MDSLTLKHHLTPSKIEIIGKPHTLYTQFAQFFFSIFFFFHDHSQFTGLQGKGEGISLTPHYHFHSLHRHLDISWAITAESSPLHIASSRARTGNLWFPSAGRSPLSYAPLTTKLRATVSSDF